MLFSYNLFTAMEEQLILPYIPLFQIKRMKFWDQKTLLFKTYISYSWPRKVRAISTFENFVDDETANSTVAAFHYHDTSRIDKSYQHV